jgi:hypothetical protein
MVRADIGVVLVRGFFLIPTAAFTLGVKMWMQLLAISVSAKGGHQF